MAAHVDVFGDPEREVSSPGARPGGDGPGTRDEGSPAEVHGALTAEVDALREQVTRLTAEREAWLEERAKLLAELEELRARVAEAERGASEETERGGRAEAGAARALSVAERMLMSPQDEAVQLQGIEALFAQQTQVEGAPSSIAAAGGVGSSASALEAAVAIFCNHRGSPALLLKASQFLSVLLAEPNAQQQLPLSVLSQAAEAVVATGCQLLAGAGGSLHDSLGASGKGSGPSLPKLLTWLLSLLALLLPSLQAQLRDPARSEPTVKSLLGDLVHKLLSSVEAQQEAIALKCVQLVPLLPAEPWIQTVCLDSGAVHSLALVYHRCVGALGASPESTLPKAIRTAVRGVFTDNLELCAKAVSDTFISDEFVCLEVLEELRGMEKKQRGSLRAMDSDWGITGKALMLWSYHQRKALESPDPLKCMSKDVLQKVAALLRDILLKLPPQVFLQRLQDFQDSEALQRLGLACVHSNAQLRLQLAVNYLDNGVIPVLIGSMQAILRQYEGNVPPPRTPTTDIEAAFRLLGDAQWPAEGWSYVLYCLEVCLHILSHWSATKLSLEQKADVLDSRAAPLLLAQEGLVDVLAELIEPAAAGFELYALPPPPVVQKATETLQALFEQNGHICLFCMQHYTQVRQMVAMGCDSISADPLAAFPDLQQQAVSQLMVNFEKYAVTDERLGRKVLKALNVLFESSYHLVAWFLQQYPLSSLGDYASTDVHVHAVRAVARAPYWCSEDAPPLPELVDLLSDLLLKSIEGHSDQPAAAAGAGPRRFLDLTEAEEVVAACMASVLHLLMIDPSPPTVLECLARCLHDYGKAAADPDALPPLEEDTGRIGSEFAVNSVMKIMQVFPSSDRVQMSCQHLLSSLLGE